MLDLNKDKPIFNIRVASNPSFCGKSDGIKVRYTGNPIIDHRNKQTKNGEIFSSIQSFYERECHTRSIKIESALYECEVQKKNGKWVKLQDFCFIAHKELYNNSQKFKVKCKPYSKNTDLKIFNNGIITNNAKIYLPDKEQIQYSIVSIYKRNHYVHRLVADAFLSNNNSKYVVDHIDCNKGNNCVANLRWVSQRENMNNEKTLQTKKQIKRYSGCYIAYNIHTNKVEYSCENSLFLNKNTGSSQQIICKIAKSYHYWLNGNNSIDGVPPQWLSKKCWIFIYETDRDNLQKCIDKKLHHNKLVR
jgi:hypothetical protein